jgi:hypothetical protein
MFSGKHEIIVVCLSRRLTSQVGSFAPPSEEIFSPPFLYIVQRDLISKHNPASFICLGNTPVPLMFQILRLGLIIYYTLYEI